MTIERLNESQLKSLAEVLGETNEGLSNAQIGDLLSEAGIDDSRPEAPPGHYVAMSKMDRLFEAWRRRQQQDRSPNAVLRCIEIAMQPVRYAGREAVFEERQAQLNQRLLHIGIEVSDRGKLVQAAKANTVSEARTRTRRLRAKLEERSAHPKVLAACHQEIRDENYFHIVLEASKSLANEIRQLADRDGDGIPLVNAAFNRDDGRLPRVAWNRLDTRTDRSEHDGLTNLCRGVIGAFRNPVAHEQKITWEVTEEDALDICSTISLLHRRLEAAVPIAETMRQDAR